MKRKIAFIFTFLVFAFNLAIAQMPNGFHKNYSYAGTYDSYGNEVDNATAAPKVSVVIVTLNFGFIQSAAILTQNFGFVGSNKLTFDNYTGIDNGWHVYVADGGPAGVGYLLISQDGQELRHIPMFERGSCHDYVSD